MPSGITDFVGSEDLRVDPTPQGPGGQHRGRPQEGGEAPPPEKPQRGDPSRKGKGAGGAQGGPTPTGEGPHQGDPKPGEEGAPQATPTRGEREEREGTTN